MSIQRKLLLLGCFIIIDVLLVGSFFLLRNDTLENVLENEVDALVKLDFNKDRFNLKVKSSGEHRLVEETIKEYLDIYAIDVQNIDLAVYDKTLSDSLSIENIVNDGPLFEESFNYIENYRNKFNEDIDVLINRSEGEYILKYIQNYTSDSEVIDLYQKMVKENNFITEIENTKLELVLEKVEVNSYFDSIVSVLEFLKSNSDNYYIENNEIKFTTMELYHEYVKLVEKTKRIYS